MVEVDEERAKRFGELLEEQGLIGDPERWADNASLVCYAAAKLTEETEPCARKTMEELRGAESTLSRLLDKIEA